MLAPRWLLVAAALSLGIATALGAYGVHGLKEAVSEARYAAYESAVQIQFVHSLGLALVALIRERLTRSNGWLTVASALLLAGMVMFSGSIYATTLGAPRAIGMMAPFGGSSLMLAWLCAAIGFARR
ncbi:MAG: DUF423 domain-containing protein [Steroidobacteraceae bacterium]